MLDPEITAQAYLQQRDQPGAPLLLDVREPWEFQTASLSNALLMPMGEITSRAHQELEHVQSLAGGIDHWSRSIDPAIPRYRTARKHRSHGRRSPQRKPGSNRTATAALLATV